MRHCTRILILLAALFTVQNLFAANIVITSVSRASGSSVPASTATTGTVKIYGGISGPACAATATDTFCDSCTAEEVSCNKRRIHDSLRLRINFKVTGAISGPIQLGFGDDADLFDVTDFFPSTTEDIGQNQSASVDVYWGAICDAIGIDCISAAQGGDGGGDIKLYLSVGDIDTAANRIEMTVEVVEPEFDAAPDLAGCDSIDPDVGLCNLDAKADDERVFIDPVGYVGDCSTTSVAKFRIFYSAVGFDSAGYDASTYTDLPINSDCTPNGDWIVEGLQNDAYYFFRVATIDKADNAAFLTDFDSGSGDDLFQGGAGCTNTQDDTNDAACTYIAKPGNVVGLLPESLNCFVATAAFGSPFHPLVKVLRQFRDEILKPPNLGRQFIHYYYAKGPIAAKWISDKPVAKKLTQIALLPVTAAAWFTLYYGPWGTALVFLVLLLFSLQSAKKARAFSLQKISAKKKSLTQNKNSHTDSSRTLRSLFYVVLSFVCLTTSKPHAAQAQDPKVGSGIENSDFTQDITEIDDAPIPQIKKKNKVIDPQSRQESRFIEHPGAAKGLIKIDKERNYIYKVKATEQDWAASVRLGTYEPLELSAADRSDITYEDLYSNDSFPILLYDQEKQFSKKFGKLGWKWGTGLKMARGHGVFEDGRDEDPQGTFTLLIFPFNAGFIYRMQYWDSQILVPYVEAGVDAFAFTEYRDDNNPTFLGALGLAPAAHASAGASIQLGRGARSFLDLDREYGINSMWLSAEYRYYAGLSEKFDFTGDAITAGIVAEY